MGVNSKLEIVLGILRVAFFFNDIPLLMKYMDKAKKWVIITLYVNLCQGHRN